MIKIQIETDGDAFADGKLQYEVGRILAELSNRLIDDQINIYETIRMKDVNGNTVGVLTYEE